MKIGPMRHRVTLQTHTLNARDAYGAETRSWTDVGTYYAEVVMLSGRELVNAQQVNAQVTHRVRMRWHNEVRPDQRLIFDGKVLNILSVNNVEYRNRENLILCQEVVVPS